MLSQKARYALRALFLLARRPSGRPVMIAEIAEEARIPRKFLEQILLELKKRGILHSVRGKFGGYTLGRAPDKISFAEVIRAIDGPLALSPCVSVTAYRRCDDCVDEATCTLRKVLLAVRDSTANILESRTLAEGLEETAPAPSPKRTRHGTPVPAE
jgi:Rrf2 family protein